ncbi:MAG: hypothetical protein OEM96_05575 [Gemmatimonadota bacterium]|nr:hypothetical protein [Gemmatimonadota bacterium]
MNTEFARLTSLKAVALASLALVSAACGEDTTGPGGTNASVSLSVAVPAAAPVPAIHPAFPLDIVYNDGVATLTLTRVALVLRDVELEKQFDECDPITASGDDGCEEFNAGPVILELPMDGTVDNSFSISGVPADTYDELEFKVHKPEDNTAEDLAFIAANPDFDGVSIRVEGDFDGQSFVYETDLNEEQEVQLSPPLVVTDGTSLNVTFSVDVGTWFRALDGSLIDPVTANKGQPNENLVKDNIRSSIDVFEDNDRDGHDDSSDD